jgi:hypothetical protein
MSIRSKNNTTHHNKLSKSPFGKPANLPFRDLLSQISNEEWYNNDLDRENDSFD